MESKSNITCLKADNRGVSLVEIVVVVGILVILASVSASAMGFLARGNVKEAAKTVYSAIASNQTYSKAKAGEWTFLCYHNGTQFVLDSTCVYTDEAGTVHSDNYEQNFLGDRVVSVRVKDSAEATYADLSTITFHKNTGAVKEINGTAVPKAGYADIEIGIEGGYAYLRLYYLTGEIEMR